MYKKINPDNKIFNSPEFQKDKYKFNIVSKILAREEVLLYSDEKNYFLARNKAGNPTWIWTKDELKDKKILEEIKEQMENQIKQKHLYCWKNKENKIVSIAKFQVLEDTAKIRHVFTLKEERSKGYATNLIHDLTEKLLIKGLKPLLYTDYNYPSSNKAYINAGYEDKGILINFSCSKENL